MEILIDDLSDGAIIKLLSSHLREMHKYSPPESIHALDVGSLKEPGITFWGARVDGNLVGCGALKELSSSCGEVKSMKTEESFLRSGIAAKILEQIITEADHRSYTELKLETGSNKAFIPAITLYEKFGFKECGPFGEYKLDPYSKFFIKPMK